MFLQVSISSFQGIISTILLDICLSIGMLFCFIRHFGFKLLDVEIKKPHSLNNISVLSRISHRDLGELTNYLENNLPQLIVLST
uniref:Uncharacterized protein n=1 Tax=Arundo donax TaxID=35708 RepID=A0A0A8YFJ1_ARUDO